MLNIIIRLHWSFDIDSDSMNLSLPFSRLLASARLCTIENGILVHGCQLMVPWILIGNIHGVTPPYVTLDLA